MTKTQQQAEVDRATQEESHGPRNPKWWERSDSLFLGDYEFIPAEVIRIGRAKEAEGDASPAAE